MVLLLIYAYIKEAEMLAPTKRNVSKIIARLSHLFAKLRYPLLS